MRVYLPRLSLLFNLCYVSVVVMGAGTLHAEGSLNCKTHIQDEKFSVLNCQIKQIFDVLVIIAGLSIDR